MDEPEQPRAREKKVLLTAYVEPEVAESIRARAKLLQWAVSKTAGAILDDWQQRGCPGLSELEKNYPRIDRAKPTDAGDEVKRS